MRNIIATALAALLLWSCDVSTQSKRTVVEHSPQGTTRHITISTSGMSQEQADSLMQEAMQEMQRTDSLMDAMMQEMLGGDPFAGAHPALPPQAGGSSPQPQQQPQRQAIKSTTAQTTLAGSIGNEEMVLVLNLQDPQNVKGSGTRGSQKMHLLGIEDGYQLTVSAYTAGGNQLLGTMSGEFDGRQYRGVWTDPQNRDTRFALAVQ